MVKFFIGCAVDILVGWMIFGSEFMELVFIEPLTIMYCVIVFLWIMYHFPCGKNISGVLITIGILYTVGTMIYLFSEAFRNFFNSLFGISYTIGVYKFEPSTWQCVLYGILTWGILWCLGVWNAEAKPEDPKSNDGRSTDIDADEEHDVS